MPDAPQRDNLEGKFFAIISYVTFFCILSIFLKRSDPFVLHHAKNGLVIFIIEVITSIIAVIPGIGLLSYPIYMICAVAAIWGILQALAGREVRMPVISDIADKINL